MNPENLFNPALRHDHLRLVRFAWIRVDDFIAGAAVGGLNDQRRCAASGQLGQLGIQRLLKSPAGFRPALGVPRTATPDRGFLEVGRLQQNRGGRVGDLRLGAAHDSGQRNGPLGIGDDQIVGLKLQLRAVQQLQTLFGTRAPHDDPASTQEFEIERMQRLTPLEHHIVGDIDDVVDRPHAGGGQRVLHPLRRWTHPDPVNQDGGVARASLRILDLNAGSPLRSWTRLAIGSRRLPYRAIRQRRDLSRDSQDREVIRPIGRRFDIQDHIAQDIRQRRPWLSVGLQFEYAFVLVRQSQLTLRTDHAQ